jgi:hypothetical protein
MNLWKSFVKMAFFNDRNFHFQKSLIKSKLKIGSIWFLIWVFWHSYVLKKNNLLWLPWFQMVKNNKSIIFYDSFQHPTHFLVLLNMFWPRLLACTYLLIVIDWFLVYKYLLQMLPTIKKIVAKTNQLSLIYFLNKQVFDPWMMCLKPPQVFLIYIGLHNHKDYF